MIPKTEVKKLVNLFLLMIGTVVGVGFVTGAEIYSFFARFVANSIFGLVCFFVLFFALTYKILTKNKINENELKLQNFDKNFSKNTNLRKFCIKNYLVFFNVLMIASAMFSGLKYVIFQLFFSNQILIFLFCVFFVFACLFFGVRCLTKVNGVLILFLIFVVLSMVLGMKNCSHFVIENGCKSFGDSINFSFKNITLSLLFAGIYVFMNIVEIEPVVGEFNINFSKKLAVVFAGLYSFVLVFLLGIFCLFLNKFQFLTNQSMPMLTFFESLGKGKTLVFSIGLVLCLLTTLISCLIGIKKSFMNKKVTNLSASFLATILAMIIGTMPFSFFVNVIYPIIGIVNFVIYVFL